VVSENDQALSLMKANLDFRPELETSARQVPALDFLKGWPSEEGRYLKTVTTVRRTDTAEIIRWSDLSAHLIGAHGFFQGRGSAFRLEPGDLVQILFESWLKQIPGLEVPASLSVERILTARTLGVTRRAEVAYAARVDDPRLDGHLAEQLVPGRRDEKR